MTRRAISGTGMACLLAAGIGSALLIVSCRGRDGDRATGENHLSRAASPYLREQSQDPVDWYEWGNEALTKAKKENKPLLISIGYSACHWCHIMKKETFTDSAVAQAMNANFVCIKVDREERPDIDKVYSEACQMISGNAGWPLNAFALPNGKPFFAGTYYSKQSWINLLKQIAEAYKTQRNKIDLQAEALSTGIANPDFLDLADSGAQKDKKTAYDRIFEDLYKKMDLSNGGLQGTPKFPLPASLGFALQYYFVSHDKRALDATTNTLTKMALGGIYDQVGGGFARYATDSLWHIPHFEKMLCDNAQLLSVYAHAYQLTHNVFFKAIIRETIAFIERDLGRPAGGYFSSLDADTRDGEGEFYAWKPDEVKNCLKEDASLVAGYYHVSDEGNWKEGKSILFASVTPLQFAQTEHVDPGTIYARFAAAKERLLRERDKREKPFVDDKILTSWNALLLNGYLDAYAAVGEPEYLQYAMKTARFLESNMLQKDGKLWHCYKDGKAFVDGFLDDYAYLSASFLRLYELSFSRHWLDLAEQLAGRAVGDFFDPVSGIFFYTGRGSDSAVIRQVEITDNNTPSANAVMAEVLFKLGHYFENEDYLNKSSRMLSRVHDQLTRGGAVYYAKWACLSGLMAYGSNEVAIVGKDAPARNLDLQKEYLPLCLFAGSTGEENLPLLKGKNHGPETLIYVCTNKVCKRPVSEAAAALEQLRNKKGE